MYLPRVHPISCIMKEKLFIIFKTAPFRKMSAPSLVFIMRNILFPSKMCYGLFSSGWLTSLAPPPILLLYKKVIPDQTDKYFKLAFNYGIISVKLRDLNKIKLRRKHKLLLKEIGIKYKIFITFCVSHKCFEGIKKILMDLKI